MRMLRVQHVRDEAVRERRLLVEQPDHFLFRDDENPARHHRRGRPDANALTGQRALAEEVARAQHRDDRFLAGVREDREPDGAGLDVHDAVARVALREDGRRFGVFDDVFRDVRRFEKRLGRERRPALTNPAALSSPRSDHKSLSWCTLTHLLGCSLLNSPQ